MRLTPSFLRLAIVGLCFATGMHAAAEDGVAPKDEIRDVIRSQLDAFKRNDFKSAYGFAHSGVQQQFTQAQFEQMVRGGFPSMLAPGALAFAEVQGEGDGGEIQGTLTDEKGNRSAFRYILEKENGKWRIAAVIPIELSDQLA